VVAQSSGGSGDGSDTGSGGGNILELMMTNNVVWHKSCRNAVDSQKVERARKRHKCEAVGSPIKTCRLSSGTRSSTVDSQCLFCDVIGNRNELLKAATLGLDHKVRECAPQLGDKYLLDTLAAGDMIAISAV